jgi:hypothetical protein
MTKKDLGVFLKFTEEEWSFLEQTARDQDKRDFRIMLNIALHHLADGMHQSGDCKDCEPIKRKANIFFIPPHISPIIACIAKKNNISVAAMVMRTVVNPIFVNMYEEKGYLKR